MLKMAKKKKPETGNKRLDELLAKLEEDDKHKLIEFIEGLTFEQLSQLQNKEKLRLKK